MATIHSSSLPNGLPIHRVQIAGTRALTVLVAFDAGARTERPDENGMAHFLEHLVFKGGEKYDDYRKVNETAERMGAVLNAYTSHDLVAFHITCRAEVAGEAIDLLTDFVGRPKIDAEELDRERGVVIQEIARSNDQPSVVAEHLIDRAAFGDHPLGRPVLGPEEHLRTFSRAAVDPRDVRARAALTVYSTLLGGSMGSRLFDEIREQRGLAYSVYSIDHSFADVPILQLSAGLESGKTGEAYARMREIVDELRTDGPNEEEFERARAYAGGRRVLAFENTNAVARHAASQTVVFGQDISPDAAIAAIDETSLEDVTEVARGISEELSVAVVGPHETTEFN